MHLDSLSYTVATIVKDLSSSPIVRKRLARFATGKQFRWKDWLAELEWLGKQRSPINGPIQEDTGKALMQYLYGLELYRHGDYFYWIWTPPNH